MRVIMTNTKTGNKNEIVKGLTADKLLGKTIIKNSKYLVCLVLVSVVSGILSSLDPVFYRKIIDDAIPNKNVNMLLICIALMAFIPLVNMAVKSLDEIFGFKFSNGCERDMRAYFFAKILRMNYPAFMRIGPVKLMSFITRSIGRINTKYLNTELKSALSNSIQLIIIFIILFRYNKIVAVVTFAVVPLIFFGIKIFRNKIAETEQRWLSNLNNGDKFFLQVFNGMKTVRSYSGQEKEMEEMDRWLDNNSKYRLSADKVHMLARFFIPTAVSQIVLGCIFTACAFTVMKDSMTIGTMVAIISYVPKLIRNIESLMSVEVGKATISKTLEELNSILSEEDEYNSGDENESLTVGGFAFNNVDFTYGRENFDLKIENLEIEKGDFVTIVGSTGGGKSSIMDIINKYYPISGGSVTLGGKSIDEIDTKALRAHIGTMFQDVYMFNGTIAENISYPEKPDMDKINEVMKKAQLAEFVDKLPNKAEEIVETGGENFSGGECQRMALARMLYKDSDIYLLDEPTAALDAGTSKSIFDMLAQENKNGKTIIAITHDAGKATYGNKVLVVNGGRIVEFGTPEELLEKNGAFASLYSAQQKMA